MMAAIVVLAAAIVTDPVCGAWWLVLVLIFLTRCRKEMFIAFLAICADVDG